MNTEGLDIADNKDRPINSRGELLDYFEQELAKGRSSLQAATDKDLTADWTMKHNNRVINVRSKEDIIRMAISQVIHHRAQLGVFLRLLEVPIPGSYGPSADDMPML